MHIFKNSHPLSDHSENHSDCHNRKKWIQFAIYLVLFGCIASGISLAIASIVMKKSFERIYFSVEQCPQKEYAVILGNSPFTRAQNNIVFETRLNAGAELYHAGKVKRIIVSGAVAPEKYYNETTIMKNKLVELGVPANVIEEDRLGMRTLDTVLRMKHVFEIDDYIAVSQASHLRRMIYLADQNNCHIHGFAALDQAQYADSKITSFTRAALADVKAMLDVALGISPVYSYDTPSPSFPYFENGHGQSNVHLVRQP